MPDVFCFGGSDDEQWSLLPFQSFRWRCCNLIVCQICFISQFPGPKSHKTPSSVTTNQLLGGLPLFFGGPNKIISFPSYQVVRSEYEDLQRSFGTQGVLKQSHRWGRRWRLIILMFLQHQCWTWVLSPIASKDWDIGKESRKRNDGVRRIPSIVMWIF